MQGVGASDEITLLIDDQTKSRIAPRLNQASSDAGVGHHVGGEQHRSGNRERDDDAASRLPSHQQQNQRITNMSASVRFG